MKPNQPVPVKCDETTPDNRSTNVKTSRQDQPVTQRVSEHIIQIKRQHEQSNDKSC
jgi:hypothetical protein